MMNFSKLQKLADKLSQEISRFQLAQLEKDAEQGRGELAGLTRFEIGELTRIYEKIRLERV